MSERKVKSVLELGNYQVGDTAWWVIFRPMVEQPELADEDQWMKEHHPKVLFTRGPYQKMWPKKVKLPKLQYQDFEQIVPLLLSKLRVEQFTVCDVVRSRDTGEFFYSNDIKEWMPESYLFDSKIAADRERSRIMKMMQRWAE